MNASTQPEISLHIRHIPALLNDSQRYSVKKGVKYFTIHALRENDICFSWQETDISPAYYRLSGFDRDWIPAAHGWNNTRYTRLKPGKYKFELCDSGYQVLASRPIFIRPVFYQTLWFKGALVAIKASVIVFLLS